MYNNALLDRDLGPDDRASAIDAMEAAYGAAGVDRYAAWVHETDAVMRAELSGRGYTVAETTRWMGMSLEDISPTLGEHPFVRPKWPEYLQYLEHAGVPEGLLSGADPSRFTSSWRGSPARTSPPRWPSTTMGTAVCSTSRPSSTRGDAASGPR